MGEKDLGKRVMTSSETVRHTTILAFGALTLAALIGCASGVEPASPAPTPTVAPPTLLTAPGPDVTPPDTDAVILRRLPGMIGASRPIRLKDRDVTLQLVDYVSKDSIPAIDDPVFLSASEASAQMAAQDLVIGLSINGEHKAYSTAFLSSHEVVNDVVGGIPVAVTW